MYVGGELVESLVIPTTVTVLNDYTFYGCSSIKSVTFHENVSSIGGRTFMYCYGLTSVEVPGNVTSLGNYAFGNCTNLKTIILNSGLHTIGNYAFMNTAITTLTVPATVTSLGNGALNGCTSLETLMFLSESAFSIGTANFYTLTNSSEVYFKMSASALSIFLNDSSYYATAYNLSATELMALSYCYYKTNPYSNNIDSTELLAVKGAWYFDEGGATILYWVPDTSHDHYDGPDADGYYDGLCDVCGMNMDWTVSDDGTTITAYTGTATKVLIPNKINDIEITTVKGNGKTAISAVIEYLYISDGILEVGAYLMDSSKTLVFVYIGARTVGDAFELCTSLETVILGKPVTQLDTYAFYGCSGLETLVVKGTLTSIKKAALGKCSSSLQIYFEEMSAADVVAFVNDSTNYVTSTQTTSNPTASAFLLMSYCYATSSPYEDESIDSSSAWYSIKGGWYYDEDNKIVTYSNPTATS